MGEVIRFVVKRETVKYFDSDTASCIANLARLPHNEEIEYPQSGNEGNDVAPDIEVFNQQWAVRRLVHFIAEEKPFFTGRIDPRDLKKVLCVKGKKTNDRISSQSGAFLLFGDNAKLSESGDGTYKITRFAVRDKNRIVRELDVMNINESTVFPYIENSAKYVAKKFSFKAGDTDT